MTVARYSLHDTPFDPDASPLFPSFQRFAIIGDLEGLPYLVLRTRSNGQTFALVYREKLWARRGLAMAQAYIPGARLYDRQQG